MDYSQIVYKSGNISQSTVSVNKTSDGMSQLTVGDPANKLANYRMYYIIQDHKRLYDSTIESGYANFQA